MAPEAVKILLAKADIQINCARPWTMDCFSSTDYNKTLMAWFANFNAHWGELKSRYSERFYRMWKFYLLSCAGSFRSRKNQLWQIVFSKRGVPGGYTSVR